ncbi:MAG: hypothetical protein AAGI50_19515 [Pseudomonadota bacterium]
MPQDEPFLIAIGGFEPRPGLATLRFQWLAVRSFRQARHAKGVRHADAMRRGRTYFSLTVWETASAMKAYATSGAHLEAMRAAGSLARSSRFHRYWAAGVPDWPTALAAWDAAGRAEDKTGPTGASSGVEAKPQGSPRQGTAAPLLARELR